MSDYVYVIKGGKDVVRLESRQYDRETDFQDLLERFPDLLAGELIDPESPRRWLLVGREVAVPDSTDGGGRWALDHLFIDQDECPTLVEVKRQSDTRLRREVVGQMLDYAANAARYWPAELLQETFAMTCKKAGKEPTALLREFLGDSEVLEGVIWRRVADRLSAGEMRLIFFADRIGTELQRIVEFLNAQMPTTEVLALEVRRYMGGDLSTHIPRIVGHTATADFAKKSKTSLRRKWTERDFLEAANDLPETTARAICKLLNLSKQSGWQHRYGTGAITGTLNVIRPNINNRSLFSAGTNGDLHIPLGWLGDTERSRAMRDQLAVMTHDLFGVELRDDLNSFYPSVGQNMWVPSVDRFIERVVQAVTALDPDEDA